MPFKISLTDDNILEEVENFFLTISYSSLPNDVTIGDPSLTIITIMDNDCKFLHNIIIIVCVCFQIFNQSRHHINFLTLFASYHCDV